MAVRLEGDGVITGADAWNGAQAGVLTVGGDLTLGTTLQTVIEICGDTCGSGHDGSEYRRTADLWW